MSNILQYDQNRADIEYKKIKNIEDKKEEFEKMTLDNEDNELESYQEFEIPDFSMGNRKRILEYFDSQFANHDTNYSNNYYQEKIQLLEELVVKIKKLTQASN